MTPQPPTDEEADELAARLRDRSAKLAAGEFESEEERRAYEDFRKAFEGFPPIPADFKFDREEAHERR